MTSRTSRIVIARTTTRPSLGCSARSARPRRRRKDRPRGVEGALQPLKYCRRLLLRRRRSRNHQHYPASREKQGSPSPRAKKGRHSGRRRRRSRRRRPEANRATTAASTTSRPSTRRRVRGKSTRGVIRRASHGRWPSRSGTASGRLVVGGANLSSVCVEFVY